MSLYALMVDLPPRHESEHKRMSHAQKETVRILREASELMANEDEPRDILSLFRERVSDKDINQMRTRLTGFSRTALRSVTPPDTLPEISDDTAINGVAMKRARHLWNYGSGLIESKEDMDAWLRIVTDPNFFTLTDRNTIFDGNTPPTGVKISNNFNVVVALDLYKAIVRVGGDDADFITSMALKITEMADEDSEMSPEVQALARAIIRDAQKIRREKGIHSREPGPGTGKNRTIDDINELAKTPNDEDLLALEIVKLRGIEHTSTTASEVLARVEFLDVSLEILPFLTTLRPVMQEIFKRNNPDTTRDSLDYIRGASRLLFSSLDL